MCRIGSPLRMEIFSKFLKNNELTIQQLSDTLKGHSEIIAADRGQHPIFVVIHVVLGLK